MAYPQLIRFDPLVVRITDTSLMISNVIFSAECVRGLAFTGFRIYASCVGNPIYEEKVKVEQNASEDNAMRAIKTKVNDWMIKLQSSVETTSRAIQMTSIKDSIDRAGWQQHYDLVGSSYPYERIDWKNYHVDDSGTIEGAITTQTQRINAMNNTLNTVRDQVYDAGDGNTLRFYTKRSFEAIWKYDGFTEDTYADRSGIGQIYHYVVTGSSD